MKATLLMAPGAGTGTSLVTHAPDLLCYNVPLSFGRCWRTTSGIEAQTSLEGYNVNYFGLKLINDRMPRRDQSKKKSHVPGCREYQDTEVVTVDSDKEL